MELGQPLNLGLLRYLDHPSRGMREAVEEAISLVDFAEDPFAFGF